MSKKTLKTILSMCLILALVASLSVAAFAEGTTKDTLYLITTKDKSTCTQVNSLDFIKAIRKNLEAML